MERQQTKLRLLVLIRQVEACYVYMVIIEHDVCHTPRCLLQMSSYTLVPDCVWTMSASPSLTSHLACFLQ